MASNGKSQNYLESIIKIEPEEFKNPNENKSRWTALDEALRKKAKIFSDPIVRLEKIPSKKRKVPCVVIRNIEYRLARKGNVGLACKDPHTCYICAKVFAVRDTLARHLRNFHSKGRVKFCDHCPKRYFDKASLRMHMKSHMKRHLTCNVCDFRTADRGTLRAHKLTHVQNEKCKICDKRVTSLRMHMIGHAPKEICPICGQKITKYGLKTHLKTHDKHKCTQCDKILINSEDLRRHILRSHHHGEVFECHCGSVFKNRLLLYTHKIKHKSEKVVCNVCGKSYAYETGFRRHWKEQHFKTHGPVRKKAPEIHRSNVTLNHDSARICDKCGSKHSNRLNFRNHINKIHLNPKTYACDLCPKIFKMKQEIPIHMRDLHLNLRPFACDICGYKSNTKNYLEKHLSRQSCRSECKICHWKVANMALHMTYHVKVTCPKCKISIKQSNLKKHIKLYCRLKL